jgi:hypothetical protein
MQDNVDFFQLEGINQSKKSAGTTQVKPIPASSTQVKPIPAKSTQVKSIPASSTQVKSEQRSEIVSDFKDIDGFKEF